MSLVNESVYLQVIAYEEMKQRLNFYELLLTLVLITFWLGTLAGHEKI
ncbi:hypothetical protein swp_4574 [Shewanella piezotolerans WP3]|uniref:Uncharacterized protein n=1 Tax=Shewanella piezotolerans (strain WP3 / JCM 13877) TaxID=225849 RepID=B8CUM2_SHEPW|nr:hypothetical protein swp_4574 [Shewanella piezotolerans WP3]